MDIKNMIDGHREMIDTMAASLKDRGFDKALLHRPVELHEERAVGVKARIEALEAARHDYVAKIDGNIKALKSELSAIESRIKTERQHLATVMKATGSKPTDRTTTVTRSASTDRKAKAAPAAAAKRSAKPRPAKTAPAAAAKRSAKSRRAKASAKRPKKTGRGK